MTNPAVAGLLAELSDVLARLGAAMQPETRGPDVDEAPPVSQPARKKKSGKKPKPKKKPELKARQKHQQGKKGKKSGLSARKTSKKPQAFPSSPAGDVHETASGAEPAAPPAAVTVDAAEVRAWARSQGLAVGLRGTLPTRVLAAYTQEHPPAG